MFKNPRKAIPFVLVTSIFTLTTLTISAAPEPKAEKKSVGETLYLKKCAACHGKDGKGVEKMATMLKTEIADYTKVTLTPELTKEWQLVLKEGNKKMPAFKEKLTEAELDSVFAYVSSFTLKPSKVKSEKKSKDEDPAEEKENSSEKDK
jgi:mono/diheme cytochrome c family protein